VPEVAVVVLTFDPPDGLLEACLTSVLATGGAAQVIVVDNGRRARGRIDALGSALGSVPVCTLIEPGQNLGYAAGMNLGVERALAGGATHVALLNDDVTVPAGWIDGLLAEWSTQPGERLGAVQPMLMFPTDPPTENSLGVELGRDGAGVDIGRGTPLPVPPDPSATAHGLTMFTGGAVMLSAAFLADAGGFDPRFFLYYEDVDLALRGAEHGWRYRCVPTVQVTHIGSASTTAVPEIAAFFRERNRLWVLIRHRPWGDAARGLWLSVRRLRYRPRRVHARALWAAVLAAPRLLVERRRHR
jgi:GT2 family glycosyltransferase